MRRQPEFSNGAPILSSTIGRWNQVFSHQGRSYICVPGPGAAGVSKCIHYQFFARCISAPGKAALLFGKGSGLSVEGTGRTAGGFAKVESYLNKNRQRTHFFKVEGRREVFALQMRARKMIEGYTK